MHHGQNKPNLKHSPVSQSQQTEKYSDSSSGSKTDEKVRIITINTSSLTKGNVSSWTPQKMSLQENSWKIMHSSSPQKAQAPSCPVFFWEVLMTVALLIMALWMQGLPTKQFPYRINGDSLEMPNPEIGF